MTNTKPNLSNYNANGIKSSYREKAAKMSQENLDAIKAINRGKLMDEITALEEKLGIDDSLTRVNDKILHTRSRNAFTKPEDLYYVSENVGFED